MNGSTANSIVDIAGIVIWAVFVTLYFVYGNRLRHPIGRAIFGMLLGDLFIVVILTIHHPIDISTATSDWDSWVQAFGVLIWIIGTAFLTGLMLRANGFEVGSFWRKILRRKKDGDQ